ncbi:hypothetical protein ACO0QE_001488 [Hanseniaspora vineae]
MGLSSNWKSLKTSTQGNTNTREKQQAAIIKYSKNKNSASKKFPSKKASEVFKPPHVKNAGRIKSVVDNITKQIKAQTVKRNQEKEAGSMVSVDLQKIIDEDNKTRSLSKNVGEIGKYLAIDCEFVGVGPEGAESVLARVSIVNYYGHTVYDEFVKPKERVVDYRTWVSGIRPSDLLHAGKFEDVQQKVADIIKGRVLVGHSVYHDLDALLLSHPKSMIRDTSRHVPYRQKYSNGKTPSLKKLAKEVLNIEVQDSEHSSVEDAKVTMLLYKFDKKEFERLANTKFYSK